MDFISQFFKQSSIDQLEPTQVHSLVDQSPKPFLLDVRTPDEFRQGHVMGAVLIPLDELSTKHVHIPKDREIICICATGSRSSNAARQLSSMGYKANNMRGGMIRWLHAGLPVQKGSK